MHRSKSALITRRDALRTSAAGIALAATQVPLRPARAAMEGELVFASNGGSYQKVFETEIFPGFSKASGVGKMTYVAGQPADNLAKLRTQKSNPAMDVMWLAGAVTYQTEDEGLLEPMDESTIPNMKVLPAALKGDKLAIPVGISTMGVLYNKEIFAQKGWAAPTSWFDLWDPKFKGRVGTFSSNSSGQIAMLTVLAKALTGDWKNLDAAFAKMHELKPNVADFFTSVGALDQAFDQHEIWISLHAVQGALQHVRAGQPVGFVQPKEGSPGYTTSAATVKGAPHPNAAHGWIDYMLSADAQAKLAKEMGYVPIHPDAKVPAETAWLYPSLNQVFVPDWRYLTTQLPSIVDRWNKVVEA